MQPRQPRGVDVFEIGHRGKIARRLICAIGEIDCRRLLQHERVDAGAAVDEDFRPPVIDHVIAGAGVNAVAAAAAMNGVIARSGRDLIAGGRASHEQRSRYLRSVQILEILDRDSAARHLVGSGADAEIHRRDAGRRQHDEFVGAGPAVDQAFAAVEINNVVAAACQDCIAAAAAVNRISASAADQKIGGGGSGDRNACAERGSVDILEIGDDRVVACRLIRAIGEIDRRRGGELQSIDPETAVD